jgi:hypothetical protein
MSSELAIVEDQPTGHGLSLSDGPDPATAVAYAAQVSTQIASVLSEGNGYSTISKKKHITIEGWQSLAAMTGHSVEVEWSRPVEGMPANAKGVMVWEARAVVRDQNGRVVASGESMADPGEGAPWGRSGNYSVRSMAQTRAMSRALSSRMRYIVQLAGFSGTPAEEMPRESAPDPLEVARARWKVLRDGLGQDNDTIKARVGEKPERLNDDSEFGYIAFMLGVDSAHRDAADEPPVEGEVVDDEALADKLFAETGSAHKDPQA